MIQNEQVSVRRKVAHRRGQALVEFAIISFVLSAIVAGLLGIMVLGLGSFQNNIAAESAGRILDGHPRLSANAFEVLFKDPTIDPYNATASQVMELLTHDEESFNEEFGVPLYDDRHLVLSPDEWEDTSGLPVLNKLLIGSYIFDPDVKKGGGVEGVEVEELGVYRYPGAVVSRTAQVNGTDESDESNTYQTVLVPLLSIAGVEPCNDDDCQCESSRWVAPLRICKNLDCDCDSDSPEASNPIGAKPTFTMSLVYPSQPASMLSIEIDPALEDNPLPGEDNPLSDDEKYSQRPVIADDDTVATKYGDDLATLPAGYSLLDPSPNPAYGASSSRGKYGLGESYAFLAKVRPYRRVFESRTAFRLRFGPLAAKYQGEDAEITLTGDSAPNAEGEYNMFLNFGQRVIDREPTELQMVIQDDPPAEAFDDFEYRALRVPKSGDGVWKISAAAEFEPEQMMTWPTTDDDPCTLELRLYRNRTEEQVIASTSVSASETGDSRTVQLIGQAVITAEPEDMIQVRVCIIKPDVATYDVQLTGTSERNWVTYEFLGD